MNIPGGAFGFPLGLTVVQQSSQPQTSTTPDQVPARVRFALSYLQFLATKEQAIGVPGATAVEVIDGPRATTAENLAREEAARLLGDYFRGQYRPDALERRRTKEAAGAPGGAPGRPGAYLRCPGCQGGTGRYGCEMCGGCGEVFIYPVHSKGGA